MQSKKCASILSILVSTSVAIALASSIAEAGIKPKAGSYKTMTATIVLRINEAVVSEFRKAWRISGGAAEKLKAQSYCIKLLRAEYRPSPWAKPISAGSSQ